MLRFANERVDKRQKVWCDYNMYRETEANMKYLKYIILLVLFLLLAFIAWGDEQKEKRIVAETGADGVQRVEVTAGSYYFDPNVIVVKVNVPVEMKIKKEAGVTPHNIVIKAPEAGIDIEESLGSEPKTIKFTPTKTGRYPFECTKRFLFFKSHKDRGMHGMLEVVE